MNRRPTAPGGAVVGTVDVTGGRWSRRPLSWMMVLSVLSAAACAESDLVSVQVNNEVSALTIMVDYLGVNQVVSPVQQLVLEVGDSVSLSATALDALGVVVGHVPVAWSSSDSGVVEITNDGLVRAVAPGAAEILASAEGIGARVETVVKETDVASAPSRQ